MKKIIVGVLLALMFPLAASSYFESKGEYSEGPVTLEVIYAEVYNVSPEPLHDEINEIKIYLDSDYSFEWVLIGDTYGNKLFGAKADPTTGWKLGNLTVDLDSFYTSIRFIARVVNNETGERETLDWIIMVFWDTEGSSDLTPIIPGTPLILERLTRPPVY